MTTAQREARTFLAQFHHRPFSISDLKKALQAQGFSLVEYSRTSNCKEVTTLLTACGCLTTPQANPPLPIRTPTCGSFFYWRICPSRSRWFC